MPHDIFISFSTADEAAATQVRTVLEHNGYKCWFAPDSIKGGDEWPNAIVDGIARARLMLVLLSQAACKSRHVLRELQLADERGIRVLPVRLEPIPSATQPYSLTGIQQIDHDPRALVDAVDALLKKKRRSPVNLPPRPGSRGKKARGVAFAIERLYLVPNPDSPLHVLRECPSLRRANFNIEDVAPNGDLLQLALEFGKPPCIPCLRMLRDRAEPNATLVFATEDFEAHTDRLVNHVDQEFLALNEVTDIVPTMLPVITGETLRVMFAEGEFQVLFEDAAHKNAALDILNALRR